MTPKHQLKVGTNQHIYIQIILILQLAPCARSAPRGLPIMPIQSCIFIPAVPGGWQKSEQSPAQNLHYSNQLSILLALVDGGGEVFLSCYMKQDLDTCKRSRCPRRGVSKWHLPPWDTQCPSTSLRICSSASLLLFCICTGFWDWILWDAKS